MNVSKLIFLFFDNPSVIRWKHNNHYSHSLSNTTDLYVHVNTQNYWILFTRAKGLYNFINLNKRPILSLNTDLACWTIGVIQHY